MGDRIAQLRHKCGLSQAKLAEHLGLSTSAIAMYEQGRREPPVAILIALADTLGVTIDYLLTGRMPQGSSVTRGIDGNYSQLAATILCAAWHIGKHPK